MLERPSKWARIKLKQLASLLSLLALLGCPLISGQLGAGEPRSQADEGEFGALVGPLTSGDERLESGQQPVSDYDSLHPLASDLSSGEFPFFSSPPRLVSSLQRSQRADQAAQQQQQQSPQELQATGQQQQQQQKAGPQFIKEPPGLVHYLNSSDLVLPCAASGNPAPTIVSRALGSLAPRRREHFFFSLSLSLSLSLQREDKLSLLATCWFGRAARLTRELLKNSWKKPTKFRSPDLVAEWAPTGGRLAAGQALRSLRQLAGHLRLQGAPIRARTPLDSLQVPSLKSIGHHCEPFGCDKRR